MDLKNLVLLPDEAHRKFHLPGYMVLKAYCCSLSQNICCSRAANENTTTAEKAHLFPFLSTPKWLFKAEFMLTAYCCIGSVFSLEGYTASILRWLRPSMTATRSCMAAWIAPITWGYMFYFYTFCNKMSNNGVIGAVHAHLVIT